jgi:hypothetical protein
LEQEVLKWLRLGIENFSHKILNNDALRMRWWMAAQALRAVCQECQVPLQLTSFRLPWQCEQEQAESGYPTFHASGQLPDRFI